MSDPPQQQKWKQSDVGRFSLKKALSLLHRFKSRLPNTQFCSQSHACHELTIACAFHLLRSVCRPQILNQVHILHLRMASPSLSSSSPHIPLVAEMQLALPIGDLEGW